MNQWVIQTSDFLASDLKSSKTILPISRLQNARSRKARQSYPGARSTCFSKVGKFSTNVFLKKNFVRTVIKLRVHVFHSRPRVKVVLTRESGKNTSNTGSKGYI